MKNVSLVSIFGLMLPALIAGCATDGSLTTKQWKCEANNLINSNYTGGDYAMIHLAPYESGGRYKVTKEGSTATGTTANGTKFVCTE
jgi:hypothetical protein